MIFFRRRPDYDGDKELTPGLRFRIWTSGWRGAFVLVTLLAAALAWWAGPDAYDWIKLRRAESLIAQSEAARERGDFAEAGKKLGNATALMQRHPVTLRAVARYQVAMHDLSALNTYLELMKTGHATKADKVAFAREAFRLGRPELAANVIEELEALPATRDSAAALALRAARSAGDGRWQEAVKLARQACVSPGSEDDLLFAQSVLARLLLQPPSPTLADGPALLTEGLALLKSLALRPDAFGTEALEILVSLSQNMQTATLFLHQEVGPLMQAAERNPRAQPALKIGAWSLRLAAEPGKRVEITQKLFDHFQNNPSPALRLEAARWLNQRGMHRLALDIAEPSKNESEDWLMLYLDAVAALGDWEQVFRTLTATADLPLPPAVRKLFELRVALKTGRQPDLTESWRNIQASARTESAANQLYVAGYAEQIGFPSEAALIYRRLLDRDEKMVAPAGKLSHPRRLACYTGLLRTGAGAMSLEELTRIVGVFAGEFPEIDEAQNDHAYLQLLAGTNLDQADGTAQKLLKKQPGLLAYRTTAALSALRRQKPGEAAAIYDGWTTEWSKTQDRFKAVYLAVLNACGREAEAERLRKMIAPDSLRPEERTLAGLP